MDFARIFFLFCGAVVLERTQSNIVNPTKNPELLWPNPTDFPYKVKHGFNDEQLANIKKGLALIEEKTCFSFTEKEYEEDLFEPHLEVIYYKDGCRSLVGKFDAPSRRGQPYIAQPIFLSPSCLDFVNVTRQFLHALGMWQDNRRPDRDKYVKIHLDRAFPRERGNLVKMTDELMTTLNTPYDYDSVMHAHPYAGASGSLAVIETIDGRYQNRIGQRVEMSFYNYYLLNHLYCKGTCGSTQTIKPCQNGGYQNPKKCTECLCKDGYGDVDCSKIANDDGVGCSADTIQVTGTEQAIYSPGYNDGGSCEGSDKGYYPNRQRCTTLLKASPGKRVRVRFEGEFGLYCHMFRDLGTCYHWLEIRLGPDLTQIGERLCCYDTPSKTFVSNGEEILLLMRTNFTAPADKRRGFKLMAKEESSAPSI